MTRYIGVDLHTNSFTVCILQADEDEKIQTYPLQGGGLERFITCLQKKDAVALEATGNSAWFRDQVLLHVERVAVIAPWQFEVIRRSVKKTDKHDARAIAFFLSKDMLPESRQKDETHTQLASVIATRDQLVKLRVSLINKVHGLFNRHGIKIRKETLTSRKGFASAVASHPWDMLEQVEIEVIAAQLESIRQGCKRLEKEITAAASALPGYENLLSIKGIGALSAAILLCTIGDIEDFAKTGNLAAYFGITPRVSQSNDSQRVGRITKRGSKIARTTLVQCTLIAKRYSPYLHDFYEHIKKTRGAGKAIIATARKLLNTIFHTLKNGWVFEDFTKFKLLPCNQS
ncbi:MAG: IS110 family transposase [Pirellulaceae bacterium]